MGFYLLRREEVLIFAKEACILEWVLDNKVGVNMHFGMKKYKDAGLMMLIASIFNLLSSLVWIGVWIWICVGVVWVIPLIFSVVELVKSIKIMNGERVMNPKLGAILGIIASVMNVNVISLVLDIIAIVNLGNMEVTHWLAGNDQQIQSPPPAYGAPPQQPNPSQAKLALLKQQLADGTITQADYQRMVADIVDEL